jgi:FSR family fosmidomycin resistance protein-like MFS transporter
MDARYYANLMIHFMNDGTVFLLPAVLPLIILEYGLTFGGAGLLSSIIPFCLGVLQTPIGGVSDRFPNTLMLRLGILIVSIGSLTAALFPSLLIPSLFLIGIGGSIYHPVGYAYTSKIVRNNGTGTALGIQSSSGDMGILAALLTAGPLIAAGGWRSTFLLWGALCFASFLLSSLIFRRSDAPSEPLPEYKSETKSRPPSEAPSSPVPPSAAKGSTLYLLLKRESILIMVLFASLGAVQRLINTYLPTVLFFEGIDITIADSITAVLVGAGIIGGILGGNLVDRYGAKKMTLAFFLSSSILMAGAFFVRQTLPTVILVSIMGVALWGIYPALYLLMREATSVSIVGTSYGLLLSLGMLSGIASISIGGLLMENSPYLIFMLGASIAAFGTVLSTKLRMS